LAVVEEREFVATKARYGASRLIGHDNIERDAALHRFRYGRGTFGDLVGPGRCRRR
jgi:hypothetical protein